MDEEEPTEREMVTQYLHQRDCPCPGCEYNLRGVTGGRCPECGQYLRMTIELFTSQERTALPWLLCLALSLSSVPFTAVVVGSAIRGHHHVFLWEYVVYALMISLSLLAVPLLSQRLRFRAAKRNVQWTMVGVVFVWWCAPSIIAILFA